MIDRSIKEKPGTKTRSITFSIWYDEQTEHIHLAAPATGWFHSTINNRENSLRRHPNLYMKLGRLLREAGVSAPPEQTNVCQSSAEDDG